MSIKKKRFFFDSWAGGDSIPVQVPVASDVTLSESAGVFSLSYTYSDPNLVLVGNNPPEIDDVVVNGATEVGDVLTIICTWRKRGQASVGASSLAIKRADDVNDLNVTTVSTLTNGIDVVVGDVVTTTFTYTLIAADAPKFLYFEFIAKLIDVDNTDSLPYLSDYTAAITFPVLVEDAFAAVSIMYDQMVFAGGEATDLVSAINRGSWGVVTTPAWTNNPTNDASGGDKVTGALRFTKADGEAISFPHPSYSAGYTTCFVINLPASATTRQIQATPRELRIDSGNQIIMNSAASGINLPVATWVAVRIFWGTTGNAYIQINKTAKDMLPTYNENNVGFDATARFGSKSSSTNSLEGSVQFIGIHEGAVADVDWDAIVDKYIT